MADDFLEAVDEGYDVLRIRVNSPDEAVDFGRNAVLARLPICLSSDSEAALDRSLFLYQGRCMIDSLCDIPEDTLKAIAARYGAVIY